MTLDVWKSHNLKRPQLSAVQYALMRRRSAELSITSSLFPVNDGTYLSLRRPRPFELDTFLQ
jgi:hypothetical protein